MEHGLAPVSVVIPCYRCSGTIERVIDTLSLQTQKPSEIILVDDFSNDGTLDALYALESKYLGWVRVIPLPANGGPGFARNAGWEAASQPYLAFLDADDAWHPRKVEIQYQWLAFHPEVALCGDWMEEVAEAPDSEAEGVNVAAEQITSRQWLSSNRVSTSSVMLRRDLPFRFAPGKRYCEDYLLWLQIATGGYQTWSLGTTLAYCFKPLYGAGGLSGRLWEMEKGELDAYWQIYRGGRISFPVYLGVVLFSLLKYLRRFVLAHFLRDKPGQG